MKKLILLTAVLAIAMSASLAVGYADSAPKPEKTVIVGQAVDIATYAMKGSASEEHAAAFKNRCEQGFPVGIVDETTGEVYIAVYRNPAPAAPMETANETLLPLMGKKVAAQGLVYRMKGVNVLRLQVVSEY